MLASVLALAPATWLHAAADSRVRTTADAPARDVVVVFGAGLRQGSPSPYLANRLDAAAELYRTGRAKVVLVTGDNSRAEYDEPDAMRTYLTERGVPDERIVSDFAGFDTWDSCVRAKKIFGVDRAVLVSQGFHIRRAIALCRSAGVDAYGVGVDADATRPGTTAAYGRSSRPARRRSTPRPSPTPASWGARSRVWPKRWRTDVRPGAGRACRLTGRQGPGGAGRTGGVTPGRPSP